MSLTLCLNEISSQKRTDKLLELIVNLLGVRINKHSDFALSWSVWMIDYWLSMYGQFLSSPLCAASVVEMWDLKVQQQYL